jgi:putative chitinase
MSTTTIASSSAPAAIDRKYFFDRIRHSLFGGRLTKTQVDAIERYLDYRDAAWPNMPDAEFAYLLATVKHETAHEMVPVEERGGEAYLRSKPYYPWHGRGPIQLTWESNYRKFGIHDPDDALKWPAALDIAFRGMIRGMFTGKKLADYISGSRRDYVGARRIINGTDKARLVAGYAEAFHDALTRSRARPAA